MKPVDSYSAINTRLDRPAPNEAAVKSVADPEPPKDTIPSAISTTASKLAAEKPPFDAQKVSDIKQQISAGSYQVDTDNLAAKMIDAGVLGVESKK